MGPGDARSEQTPNKPGEHGNHCFVVMPTGRGEEQKRWFRGWYDAVIKPVVVEIGFEPILSVTEERPSAIDDEIRTHLAFDPMAIVDLGGFRSDDPPNPNVMYELGIRHAFGLPLVLLARSQQELPFDIAKLRAIVEHRDFAAQAAYKETLTHFIRAAQAGGYYRPMEAVRSLDLLRQAAGNDSSPIAVLAQQVSDLRDAILAQNQQARRTSTMRRYATSRRIQELTHSYFNVLDALNTATKEEAGFAHVAALASLCRDRLNLVRDYELRPSHRSTVDELDRELSELETRLRSRLRHQVGAAGAGSSQHGESSGAPE